MEFSVPSAPEHGEILSKLVPKEKQPLKNKKKDGENNGKDGKKDAPDFLRKVEDPYNHSIQPKKHTHNNNLSNFDPEIEL